jgi:hypothetical protein
MMKKYIYVAVAVLLGITISFTLVKQGDAKVLNVNEIGADPAAFSGNITVTGVMAGVSEDRSIFGIMDLKELQCKSANCNKVVIPIKYTGSQPVLGDEVKVTGKFVSVAGGYAFAADKVKVVRNHRIGG